MKTIAIITARINSTRLPNKILLPLGGHHSLWWTTARVKLSRVDDVVVATTLNSANDIITKKELPFDCDIFRYDGENILDRVIEAGSFYQADTIIDITSDCPLVDPKHINALLKMFNLENFDYVSNICPRTWPDGLDVQVYKLDALKKVRELFQPEFHAGWNITQHPKTFSIGNLPASFFMFWPELGLTLDTKEDYKLLNIIFNKFGYDPVFSTEKVIDFLRKNPELLEINKHVRRKKPEEG